MSTTKNIAFLLMCFFMASTISFAQNPVKGFEQMFKAMDSKTPEDIQENMDKSVETFRKILIKDSTNSIANLGLAIGLSYAPYQNKDYFNAWKHFKKADENLKEADLDADQKAVINEYFFREKKSRRGKPIAKNMEIERNLVEEKLIVFVREENNADYAVRFLHEFPKSKYVENVEHIRNYIEFRKAENQNTIAAYNRFLVQFPMAAQVQQATRQRNMLAYNAAITANSTSALREFIRLYPESEQVENARKQLSVIAFTEAQKANSLPAIEQFISEFPNSVKIPEANIMKKKLLFEWAKTVNSIEAYNKFVAIYPEGEMFIDIFNLKAEALGKQYLMDFPMDNYLYVKAFDNNQLIEHGGDIVFSTTQLPTVVTNSPKSAEARDDNWIIGLKEQAKMDWNKIIGNEFDDKANRALMDSKDNLYVAGMTNALYDSVLVPGNAWIYKLSPKGENLFNRKLEGTEVLDFNILPDEKMMLCGYRNTGDSTCMSYLTKLNAAGKKLWSRNYKGTDTLYSLVTDSELNNCAIAGGKWNFAIDANGYLQWELSTEVPMTAVANKGEIFAFCGISDSVSHFIITDSKGNQKSTNTFDGENFRIKRQYATSDGRWIAGAQSQDNRMAIFVFNADGSLAKKNVYELPHGIEFNGMTLSSGNVLAVSATALGGNSAILIFGIQL